MKRNIWLTSNSSNASRTRRVCSVNPIAQSGKMTLMKQFMDTSCMASLNDIWWFGGIPSSSFQEILRPKAKYWLFSIFPSDSQVQTYQRHRERIRQSDTYMNKSCSRSGPKRDLTGRVMVNAWSITIDSWDPQTLSKRSRMILIVSSQISLLFRYRPCFSQCE